MYRKCYTKQKVTFSRLTHKRFRLHIPDAADNVIPYEIYPYNMGKIKVLRAKRHGVAMKLCTGSPDTVADKLRLARIISGIKQEDLAAALGIDRITLLRYENGQVSELNMQVDVLIRAAFLCGQHQYFCCNPYHIFVAEDAGAKIKNFRKSKGMTQKQFAAMHDVSAATVKRWEKNERKPSLSVWKLVTTPTS